MIYVLSAAGSSQVINRKGGNAGGCFCEGIVPCV